MDPHTIGVDLGGTNIKVGLVAPDDRLVASTACETLAGRGPDHVIDDIVRLADAMRTGAARDTLVAAIGIAAPGPMSPRRGLIYEMANLPGWKNVPLRDRIADKLGLPAILENDANAAAWGEFRAGVGRKTDNLVFLTLGTGVGGGIISEGRLLHGHFENAAEIGHMVVSPGGRPCPCGQTGCLERYASANAVAERASEAIRAGRASRLAAILEANGELTARDITANCADDELAAEVWNDACRALALAAVNLQHVFNPEVIALGGGLTRAGELLLERIRGFHRQLSWRLAEDHPRIMAGELGYEAGVIGAGALARDAVQGQSPPRR